MSKVFNFNKRNSKTRKIENVGSLKFDSINEENAELYFYGDIASESWQSYWYDEDKCPQDIADFLGELDGYKSIDIYINSGGGSVHGGLAIYNQLKRYDGFKTVHVDGLAASIASVIALAGDRVIIPSNAQMMIHKPWSYCSGNADDMRREADALDSCQKAITSVYMENANEGITEEKITELINNETWMTGAEAKEYFNIEVEESNERVAYSGSMFFDKYKNTPEVIKDTKEEVKNDNENKELKNKLQIQLDLMNL